LILVNLNQKINADEFSSAGEFLAAQMGVKYAYAG